MREFAKRLIAHERAAKSGQAELTAALLVCNRLRPHLATLMGNIGFKALLSRALALAAAEIPSLLILHINADGSFERAEGAGVDRTSEGGVVLVAQLLGLLATFIGEDLTLRLVRDVWPKASFDKSDPGKGSKNAEPK
jgi:hypothetical protein